MTEKSKNDQPHKRSYRKIAAVGCGFLALAGCTALIILNRIVTDFVASEMLGPGWQDTCTSISGVYTRFELSGYVVDAQGQPIDQANVEIGSDGPHYCIDELTSRRATTNKNGEFSFGPTIFPYQNEFFISVSIEGCSPSRLYRDQPDNEPISIVFDCIPEATTQEAQ